MTTREQFDAIRRHEVRTGRIGHAAVHAIHLARDVRVKLEVADEQWGAGIGVLQATKWAVDDRLDRALHEVCDEG